MVTQRQSVSDAHRTNVSQLAPAQPGSMQAQLPGSRVVPVGHTGRHGPSAAGQASVPAGQAPQLRGSVA